MAHFHKRIITPGDLTRYSMVYGLLTYEEDPRIGEKGEGKVFFAFGQGDLPMMAFTFRREDVSLSYFSEKFAGLYNQVTIRMGWLVLLHIMGFPLPEPKDLGEGFEQWYRKLKPGWMSTLPILPLPDERE